MRPTCPVFVFRAQLQDVEPPIWRRFEASGNLSLPDLHAALQAAFGWENCHLHEFLAGEVCFGQTGRHFDAPASLIDESTIKLVQIVRDAGDAIEYAYDFGDGWEVRLLVESSREAEDPRATFVRCLDGERAGPPEDCGGPNAFGEMLFALADSKHPEHRSMREWLARPFDPQKFDVEKVNRVLDRIGRRPSARSRNSSRGPRSVTS